jgi:kynurenine formamidase
LSLVVATGTPPNYDDLATVGDRSERCSWGLWGENDRLGALNLLTAERAVRGAACVRTGRTFRLDLALDEIDPPLYGRQPLRHVVLGDSGHDDVVEINTQTSTQWDGFRHVRHPEFGFYGGVDDADHGIDHWASRIVGRAVLADVARWREAQGRPVDPPSGEQIGAEELEATLDAQGVAVEAGDVLLIRTGWVSWYRGLDSDGREALPRSLRVAGLAPTEDTLRLLWNLHVAAVAADNPSLEAWPAKSWTPEHAIHFQLLCLLGIPIGEMFDLDALAEECAADGRYDALITSAPLIVPSGVASPPGAMCVK